MDKKKDEFNRFKATTLRKEHSQWRDTNFLNKKGFFPVFYDFKEHLSRLSGGAVSLFIYFGLHANNQTGECFHSIDKISVYFGRSTRTISSWIKELEEEKLITRIQLEMNGTSHTFIRPYKDEGKIGE
ncbi:helix-turn-helix domain-containing protein [Halalkalibacter lacteus]|uniref:helix-turn-helix domain-containing protein n=1 Tax=Halalkalibacter lacteus TaxID=3090663 RepID=UPI002FCB1019